LCLLGLYRGAVDSVLALDPDCLGFFFGNPGFFLRLLNRYLRL
jgi:hypothetical protein